MSIRKTSDSFPRVLVFIGPVGVGKSTHIRLLASKFDGMGLKVRRTSLKTNHWFARALTFSVARILSGRKRDVHYVRVLTDENPKIFKELFKLWLSLDLISVSIQFLFAIYLPLIMGYTVLVEEYIPATIADYMYVAQTIGLPPEAVSSAIGFVSKLMYSVGPTRVIFLDADTKELKLRWLSRGSSEERIDYLSMQRSILRSLSTKLFPNEAFYANTTDQRVEETQSLVASFACCKLETSAENVGLARNCA